MATMKMTNVRLCRAVPLDNTYTDTLTFASAAAQQAYFAGKTKVTAGNLSYQREGMQIRWDGDYNSIVDCNYLAYQNPNFSGKWFYAFITHIEYQNDNTSYIYFEVDAYQTFMFDVQIKGCFVEREHVADDTVGANLIDEGVALGDYVANAVTETTFDDWWIVLASTVDLRDSPDYKPSGGYVYGGIYSGASYYLFENTAFGVEAILAILSDLASGGKMDAIVGMHMIPKAIVEGGSTGGYLPATVMGATTMETPDIKSLDGYVPRNNKLLCYPYRCLQISNNDGNAITLRYEFFLNQAASVAYRGYGTPNGRIVCYPQSYKGVIRNFNESISLGNFPQCTWEKNVYANWLAAQSIRWGYQKDRWFVNSMTSLGMDAAANPNPLTPLTSGARGLQSLYNVASSMAEEKEVHSIIPPAIGGSVGSGYINVSLGKYAFTCEQKSIKAEIARSIDEYFDMFGYRVNRVKVPNINGRPSWNYVKTVDAKVIGACPVPYIDTIKSMLNRGVTFWHGDWVGDYSRANK